MVDDEYEESVQEEIDDEREEQMNKISHKLFEHDYRDLDTYQKTIVYNQWKQIYGLRFL